VPRKVKADAAGALYHIIIRGIGMFLGFQKRFGFSRNSRLSVVNEINIL
jgi:hypothetical protein